MMAVDASVLIAHLHPRDAHHVASSQLLLDAAGEPLVAHSLTLAEVLVGGTRAGRGAEMLTDLRALGVELAPRDDDEPLQLAELRVNTGLRMPDCCVLHTARSHSATLATFDGALAQAARQLGVPVAP